MDQSEMDEGSGFSFGTVEDTQIVHYQNDAYLSYNPFAFDMYLNVSKSHQNYEPVGKQFKVNAGKKITFGRKPGQAQILLKAPTISGKHFSVGEDQKLYDMGSTKGTFKWVFRDKPKTLFLNDVFLVGKTEFTVSLVDRQKCEVHLKK